MQSRLVALAALVLVLVAFPALCTAGTISAVEDERGITVTIPGALKVLANRKRGFGARMYDLKNSPHYNLSSAYSGNGLLLVSVSPAEGPRKLARQSYSNPVKYLELVESGPARVVLRMGGPHRAWGQGRALAGVDFSESFTMYPSGSVYGEYVLEIGKGPASLYYMAGGIVTTGYYGLRGLNQVTSSGEFGPKKFKGKTASSFILQSTDGPDFFSDVLFALYKGKHDSGHQWNFDEGRFLELGTNMNWTSLLPKNPIPAGSRTVIGFMIRFGDDMNSPERAAVYARDFRSPDKPAIAAGSAVRDDDGDRDGDGFNEREGCYVLKSGADGVDLTLHGKEVARISPAFKVRGWSGRAPTTISLDGVELVGGTDFVASVTGGVLILQVLKDIVTDGRIVIPKGPADEAGAGKPAEADAETAVAPDSVGKLILGTAEEMITKGPDARKIANRPRDITLVKKCAIADGKTALRIDVRADTWKLGIKTTGPENAVWDGYDVLTFDVYNPQRDINSLVLSISGEGVKARKGKWLKEMLLRPGMNKVELLLGGAPVDWRKPVSELEFSHFQMSTSVGTCLYLMNFRLKKESQMSPPGKDVNVVRIDGDKRFQAFEPVPRAKQ